MQTVTNGNKKDDPTLLYNLLNQYMGTAELVIRTYQSSFNNLSEKLKKLDFNVNKFCNYMSEVLKSLQDAGDNDKQAFIKLYEALLSTS
eukprot:15357418-Ditylum_brightwellii.AAC.1